MPSERFLSQSATGSFRIKLLQQLTTEGERGTLCTRGMTHIIGTRVPWEPGIREWKQRYTPQTVVHMHHTTTSQQLHAEAWETQQGVHPSLPSFLLWGRQLNGRANRSILQTSFSGRLTWPNSICFPSSASLSGSWLRHGPFTKAIPPHRKIIKR